MSNCQAGQNTQCQLTPTSHKANMFEKLENDTVKCTACSHYCTIRNNQRGICGIRFNVNGQLYLAPYGYPSAVHVDPMEKKPLYHFHPNNDIISFGVIGCNFSCKFCQNWSLSFTKPQLSDLEEFCKENSRFLEPQDVINHCLKQKIRFIAFTYNEPTIGHEYYRDIALLAKQNGIQCVYVSNGYMSKQTREQLLQYISAFNIDLKCFNDQTYRKIMGGQLQPVLDNIEFLYKSGAIVEVTTLVVPEMNDSDEEITQIAQFLVTKCGSDIPWHLSAFHPDHKMMDRDRTSVATLERCYAIGKKAGLKYVYLGNVRSDKVNTYCPECNHLLIDRSRYVGRVEGLNGNKCGKCGYKIYGEF